MTSELSNLKTLPETVHSTEEHERVEAQKDKYWDVEEHLGSFGRKEAAIHSHIWQNWSQFVGVNLKRIREIVKVNSCRK